MMKNFELNATPAPLLRVSASLLLAALVACGDDEPSPTDAGSGPTPTINIAGPHSVELGKTISLSASTQDGTDTSYDWSSSSPSLATVDGMGVVTGASAGELEITATGAQTGASSTHVLVVVDPGSEGTPFITITGDFSILVGEKSQLSATTGNLEGTESYGWSSSDPAVATVDATGLVHAISPGPATITATGADSGATGSIGLVVSITVPVYEQWKQSGHADSTAEAFRHWDDESPPEVPPTCSRCHSSTGFDAYATSINADPENPMTVAVPAGEVVECVACHADSAMALSTVVFPSGVQIDGLGSEARCMTCHQGRASGDTVDETIAAAGVGDDETSASLRFINQHYYAAAATLNAGRVRGGYQYEGQVYDWRFRHVPLADTCVECHNPHTGKLNLTLCAGCHNESTQLDGGPVDLSTQDGVKDIRIVTSFQDFDGDGDNTEGMYYELQGLWNMLLPAIQAYSLQLGNGGICYNTARYPYWFVDANSNGTCDDDETTGYASWTPRLLRATYNYQVAAKDPGNFAHNAKYVVQLLYDSIADLNTVLDTDIDLTNAVRQDVAHFNGAGEPARHWDEDAEVSASCSKCHSGSEGFKYYLSHGVGKEVPEQANGLDCVTCHEGLETGPDFTLRTVTAVTYPSGATISTPGDSSNLCSTCHQGRESGRSVEARIAANNPANDDTVMSGRFINIHYRPAGATRQGSGAAPAYQYAGKTYAGFFPHILDLEQCEDCHRPKANNHSFGVLDAWVEPPTGCGRTCHAPLPGPRSIRPERRVGIDYDGDGDSTEPNHDELQGMAAKVYSQLQLVASNGGNPICYNGSRYPYWFVSTSTTEACAPADTTGYDVFTPRTLKAAYNYQYYRVEPGAYAHNFDYMGQVLFDTLEDLGGSLVGMTRP